MCQLRRSIVVNMIFKLFCLCLATSMSRAFQVTQLEAPSYVDPRVPALFVCHYDTADQRLHSVKLYKNDDEFFRYMPNTKPQIFENDFLTVLSGDCNETLCQVKVSVNTLYRNSQIWCEISGEAPKFFLHKLSMDIKLVALARNDPILENVPDYVCLEDSFMLNCTSDYSLPVAKIEWYVNDVLKRNNTMMGPFDENGLVKSFSSLFVDVLDYDAINIKCQAIIEDSNLPSVIRIAEVTILPCQDKPSNAGHHNLCTSFVSISFLITLLLRKLVR